MKRRISCLIFAVLLGTGCSTMRESLVIGTGSGLATGAVAGASLSKNNRGKGALKGALIGGAIGAIASYFTHKGLEKRDVKTRREVLFNLDNFGATKTNKLNGPSPFLTKPVVDSQWVETRVEGKKLIEGHKVWIIQEDSQWIPSEKRKSK